MKRLLVAVSLIVGVLVGTASEAWATTTSVGISGSQYKAGACPSPTGSSTVTIVLGSSVQWTNCDGYEHTVTSDNGAFPSHLLGGSGGSATETFTTAGTFAYHCEFHLDEHGTVVVEAPNVPPVAKFTMTPTSALVAAAVVLDASGSSDPDGKIVKYQWYYDGVLGNTSTTPLMTHNFVTIGTHTVKLVVTDNRGGKATASKSITVTGVGGRRI
jgi:plastocyanin